VPLTLSVELFGRPLPKAGIGVAIAVFIVLFFVMSRNGGLGDTAGSGRGGRVGRGRMHQCTRCGVNYQPEQVELLSTGNTRTLYDERCPNCGWELDWKDPDKQAGGSSGTW